MFTYPQPSISAQPCATWAILPLVSRYPDLALPTSRSEFDAVWRPGVVRLLAENVYGEPPLAAIGKGQTLGTGEIENGSWQVDLVQFQKEPGGTATVPILTVEPPQSPVATLIGQSFTDLARIADFPLPQLPPVPLLPEHEGPEGVQISSWGLRDFVAAGWRVVVSPYGAWQADDPAVQGPWRAINTWAWGLRSTRKWLAETRGIKENLVAMGHSRLGKAALWAAANDEGFNGVVAIQSGCGGAAPNRTSQGETVRDITGRFPHWFIDRYRDWAGHEDEMLWDQHALLALIAPRSLLIQNAEQDHWANPRGQVEMAELAREAWTRFGDPEHLKTWIRPGFHEVTSLDLAELRAFFSRAFQTR